MSLTILVQSFVAIGSVPYAFERGVQVQSWWRLRRTTLGILGFVMRITALPAARLCAIRHAIGYYLSSQTSMTIRYGSMLLSSGVIDCAQ